MEVSHLNGCPSNTCLGARVHLLLLRRGLLHRAEGWGTMDSRWRHLVYLRRDHQHSSSLRMRSSAKWQRRSTRLKHRSGNKCSNNSLRQRVRQACLLSTHNRDTRLRDHVLACHTISRGACRVCRLRRHRRGNRSDPRLAPLVMTVMVDWLLCLACFRHCSRSHRLVCMVGRRGGTRRCGEQGWRV
jgi:hypothetical protein